MTVLDSLQFLGQRPSFGRVFARRYPTDGRLQIAQHFGHAGVVRAVEGRQLVEDVMPALKAWMMKDLPAGDHLKSDATEAHADHDARVPRVFALGRQRPEVVVADDEIVGDAEDGGAKRAVAVPHQRAVGFVYFVTLITGRSQAGAAGDALGVGVVFDGPHLAGEVGGADDVDAWGRWMIEVFHDIEKNGCSEEDRRFETAARMEACLAILSVAAVRIFQLRTALECQPKAPAEQVATAAEIEVVRRWTRHGPGLFTVRDFVRGVARLGGFLARKHDGDPGVKTLWRGYQRLQDLLLGYQLRTP